MENLLEKDIKSGMITTALSGTTGGAFIGSALGFGITGGIVGAILGAFITGYSEYKTYLQRKGVKGKEAVGKA